MPGPTLAAHHASVLSDRSSIEAATRHALEAARSPACDKAFIRLFEASAVASASALQAIHRAGAPIGVLAGAPISVKDLYDVAGFPTTAASATLHDAPAAPQDSPAVARVRAAGGVLVGHTNMSEFAFSGVGINPHFGTPANIGTLALDSAPRAPGGSTSGGTTSVAAGAALATLGSDTGGSVRIPAALNGIAGLRPTLGRYPQAGITPIARSRDTAGPMARSVADLAVLDTVVTGTKEAVEPAALKGLRLGVPRSLNEGVAAETARVIATALERMRKAGVVLVDADVPELLALNAKVSFPVALYEVTIDLPVYSQRYGIGLDFKGFAKQVASPDVKGLFAALAKGEPPSVPRDVYEEAMRVHRPALQKAYAAYFARHKLAAIVFPTTPLAAAPIGDDQETELDGEKVPTFPTFIRNTDPGSNAGIPGLSIPAGLTGAGLPVGLELDGPVGSDRKLLAIGLALERLFGPLPAPK